MEGTAVLPLSKLSFVLRKNVKYMQYINVQTQKRTATVWSTFMLHINFLMNHKVFTEVFEKCTKIFVPEILLA